MALTIHSEALSLSTLRTLDQSQNTLSKTFRRLSSGLRLNVAADDPGRLTSSVLATTKVRGVRQSIRNLNDGISLAQTLESGLAEMEVALQRLRELSVQAGNETLSVTDRTSIQEEASQIITQMQAIADQTQFNGISLLDGSAGSVEIFTEASRTTSDFSLDLVKVSPTEVNRKANYQSQRRGVYLGDFNTGDMKINGVSVRGTLDVDDELSFSYRSGSAIAKANAINAISTTTGVTARAVANRVTANRAISAFTLNAQNYFAINGEKIAGEVIQDFDADGTLRDAINRVSEESGVVASLDSQGQLVLVAEDGRNIQIHYSNMLTMLSIGLADTSGDETNLKGEVLKSTIHATDLFGSIQNVSSAFHSYGGNVTIGGEFDPGRDHVDYVAQVIRGGSFGTAQFRLARELGSETLPAEDFTFLDLDGPYTTGHSAGMEFFSASSESETNGVTGSISSTGTYNEGADRTYTITVTQEGSTDGAIKAVGDITSNVDGTIHTGVTLTGTITLGTAVNQTGEFVTLTLSGTPRGQSVSETGVTHDYNQAITQNDAAVNGVIVSGTYTADRDLVKQVRVIETGYTQGTNLARLQVFDNFNGGGFVASSAFTISTGAPIDIGHGLKIEFTPEARQFGQATGSVINRTGTAASYDSTGLDVTLSSSTLQYVGERGDGTYTLNITEAGRTGRAKYDVRFTPTGGVSNVIAAATVLNAGTVTVADGITFDFEASTPTISATTADVNASGTDHYGAAASYQSPNFTFGGVYTGNMNDTTATVEVITEGRVLEAGEASTGDAAVLRYTLAGTAGGATITATTLARVGTYNLGEGVTFTITAASAKTQLSLGGLDQGTSHTFAAGSVLGYDGQVSLNLDDNTFDRNQDLTLRLSEIGDLIVGDAGGAASSGKLLAELVNEANAVVTSASFSLTSGVANVIDTGLSITFDNSVFTAVTLTANGVINDSTASIALEPNPIYDNTLDDRDFDITFTNPVSAVVAQTNNEGNGVDDVAGADASVSGTYSGNFGDQTIDITFEGTVTSVTHSAIGGDDNAALTIAGSYSGFDGDKSLQVTYLGDSITTTANTLSNDTFAVASTNPTDNYNGLSGNKTLTVTFTGGVTSAINPQTFGGTLSVGSVSNFSRGAISVEGEFTGDNNLELTTRDSDGVIIGNFTIGVADGGTTAINLGAANTPEVSINVSTVGGADETGQTFEIDFTPEQKVTVSDGVNADVTNVDVSGAGSGVIDLGNATFTGVGKFFAVDPGIDLTVTHSTDGLNHSYDVALVGPRASISAPGHFVNNIDISGGSINLNAGTFTGVGKIFEFAPNVTLNIANPEDSDNDSWTVDLNTVSTMQLSTTNGTVNGVSLTGNSLDLDSLTDGQKQTLFSNAYDDTQSVGVDVDFSSSDLQIDDTFRLNLTKTPTVNIKEVGVGGAGQDYVIGTDFGAVTFDLDGKLVPGVDPGFDLIITDAVLGKDDSYRISLTGAEVAAANTNLISTNARTLQVGDDFTANLIADTLEIGTQYSLSVTAPHLNAGHNYDITENVGTLKVGEQLTVGSLDSRFEDTVYTMQASVTITDGLNLNFSADGPFEVGDEIRFQARGYRGDFSVSGQYTDPAYPTTFEVEVIRTGDVDGGASGALLKTTRLDNGDLVSTNVAAVSNADTGNIGGDGYLGLGVFMQFDANTGAGEAHRLYQGDIFYIDVVGSLSQNFGSQVMLESDDTIDIEYNLVDVDNQIGRLLYVGDISEVNNPGTLNSLQSAFLGVNTEFSVAKLSLHTQEDAENALRLVDDAIEQISEKRSLAGATQNRMRREMVSLEENLFQTQRYQSQITDADVAFEIAQQARAQIIQQMGAQMLGQLNLIGTLSLELVFSLTR